MTAFKSYPDVKVSLPDDSKVAGEVLIWFRGNGSVGARTEYNRLAFRDSEYSIHLELVREEDGTWTERRDYRSVRRDFSDAPPSYADKITEAVFNLVKETWTPELDRAGLEADVAQKLHRLEREAVEAETRLAEVRAEIAKHKGRL